jgi:hypothetical protein
MIARLSAFLICVVITTATVAQPLVIDGTTSVPQRVLTRAGATLADMPSGDGATLPGFQPFYVYGREGGWTQVGPTPRGATGWIADEELVDWRQNIVAAFTNAAGRERQLLFDGEDRLRAIMGHEALRDMQAMLLDRADQGTLAPEDAVVAIEPQEFVNIRDEFYIMPILDYVEDFHPLTYEDTLLMEVASLPLREGQAPEVASAEDGEDFDAGVVLVLDTTRSMEPYIEATRAALARIVGDIRGTDVGERVNFGITAFRDSPEAVPELEYRTRELLPLARRDDQTPVLDAIARAAQVTTANSPGFNEDSLAGVEDAIDDTDWTGGGADPFDGKYVILVTDAGPKDPRDPNARSAIGPAEIQRDAEGRGIVVMTLHLKTPAGGEANHAYAAGRYRALSRFGPGEFYFPVEGGSEAQFEATVSRLVTALTDHVRTALGEATVLDEDEAGENLVALGLAMRLAYLGAREGTAAPDVIRGWVSERAIEDPSSIAFEPRLMITKNELATMADYVEGLVALGETGEVDPDDFFSQLRSVMAQVAQNPDALIDAESETLGGALEFLEALPYRSQIMDMTPDIWVQSAMQRRMILDGLRQKLVQYRKWLFDRDVWTALHDGAPDGEHVFAMPFDVLP